MTKSKAYVQMIFLPLILNVYTTLYLNASSENDFMFDVDQAS